MTDVFLFTDGACSGNPGPGGWGALLRYGKTEKEISGGAAETTNNKMELTAVIEGLRLLKRPCRVQLFTDSRYVMDGALKWLPRWLEKKWCRADKKPVLNKELWEALSEQLGRHEIEWHWVKGHAGHPENERVDRLACLRRDEHFKKSDR